MSCSKRSMPMCSCSSTTCAAIRAWPKRSPPAGSTLHGWVYDIASGEVRAYDEEWQQFAAAVTNRASS